MIGRSRSATFVGRARSRQLPRQALLARAASRLDCVGRGAMPSPAFARSSSSSARRDGHDLIGEARDADFESRRQLSIEAELEWSNLASVRRRPHEQDTSVMGHDDRRPTDGDRRRARRLAAELSGMSPVHSPELPRAGDLRHGRRFDTSRQAQRLAELATLLSEHAPVGRKCSPSRALAENTWPLGAFLLGRPVHVPGGPCVRRWDVEVAVRSRRRTARTEHRSGRAGRASSVG